MSNLLRVSSVNPAIADARKFMGVDRRLFGLNAIGLLTAIYLFKFWPWIALAVVFHYAALVVTDVDPDSIDAYLSYRNHADAYDNYPHEYMRQGQRPEGYGRGVVL
jgi:hypothetical protein